MEKQNEICEKKIEKINENLLLLQKEQNLQKIELENLQKNEEKLSIEIQNFNKTTNEKREKLLSNKIQLQEKSLQLKNIQ
jgi:hypothetical protein